MDTPNYFVYLYDEFKAKANKAHADMSQAISFSVILTVAVIPFAVLIAYMSENNIFWELVGAGTVAIGLVVAAVLWAIRKQPYMNAAQQAIVRNNQTGMYYAVKFLGTQMHGWNTASRAAAITGLRLCCWMYIERQHYSL